MAAYRRTIYRAGGTTIRIGRRCPALDALLACGSARGAVLVTAWNPMSRRMAPGWNQRMQQRLAQFVRRWPALPAEGGLSRWREDHLLVIAPIPPLVCIARRFRQCAVVVVAAPGMPARLHLL